MVYNDTIIFELYHLFLDSSILIRFADAISYFRHVLYIALILYNRSSATDCVPFLIPSEGVKRPELIPLPFSRINKIYLTRGKFTLFRNAAAY